MAEGGGEADDSLGGTALAAPVALGAGLKEVGEFIGTTRRGWNFWACDFSWSRLGGELLTEGEASGGVGVALCAGEDSGLEFCRAAFCSFLDSLSALRSPLLCPDCSKPGFDSAAVGPPAGVIERFGAVVLVGATVAVGDGAGVAAAGAEAAALLDSAATCVGLTKVFEGAFGGGVASLLILARTCSAAWRFPIPSQP